MARTKTKSEDDNRKIAVYVRKSKITEMGKSIEIQKEKCIALACVKFDVTEEEIEIYEDEGKSGFYADRKNYKRMLGDIENNRIKAVICFKIDRISRRTIDLLNLVQQIEQKGIAFVSVSDKELDTSSRTGKIMLTMLSAIAEFERDIIAERITDNMYELAKEGRWLGGNPPLGYYSKKEKLTINGKKTTINHLEPVEDAQRVVKRIFELYLKLGSLTKTADTINDEGYITSQKKEFKLVAVRDILTNPVYAVADDDMRSYFTSLDVPIWAADTDFDGTRGIMAYNKTEQIKELDKDSRALDPKYTQKTLHRDIKEWIVSVGKHHGIISGAEWIKVQNTIAANASISARPKEISLSLLSGLVRCIKCGDRMYVRAESGRYNPDGTLRFRYICRTKYRQKKTGGCKDSPEVKGWELDNFVVEKLCGISSGNSDFYTELINTKNTLLVKTQEMEKELNLLNRRLVQIEQDIQNQIANLRTAPESIKQAIYADIEALHREQNEKQELHNKISGDLQVQEKQVADMEKAKQTILDFPRLIKLVDYEGKLRLIQRVLECVIVKDEVVHIFLKGTDSDRFFVKEQEGVICVTENRVAFLTHVLA